MNNSSSVSMFENSSRGGRMVVFTVTDNASFFSSNPQESCQRRCWHATLWASYENLELLETSGVVLHSGMLRDITVDDGDGEPAMAS